MNQPETHDFTPSDRPLYYYKLFGLAVRSEMEFPEFTVLMEEDFLTTTFPKVDVVLTDVPEALPDSIKVASWIEATKSNCLFHLAENCRLLVDSGKRLAIHISSSDQLQTIRPFLVSCGFATLALQNQYVPLHVSSVQSPSGIWLFAGKSGAGKSTLAAALSQKLGWPLLGDDIGVYTTRGSSSSTIVHNLHFGVNKIKLWDDAVETLSIDKNSLQQDFFRPNKFHLPIQVNRRPEEINKISAIFQLAWVDDQSSMSVKPISGSANFELLMNSVFPPPLVPIYRDLHYLRRELLGFASQLAGFKLSRTKAPHSLSDVISELLNLKL